ncbi:MAG: hypothetical protein V4497_01495 [Bacteroidota bacterium]
MKNCVIVLFFLIVSSLSNSQTKTDKKSNYSENSEITVIYHNEVNLDLVKNKSTAVFVKKKATDVSVNKKRTAVFINDIFMGNEIIMNSINPEKIKTIKVEKELFEKNGKEYYGKIFITMKRNYKANFMTLEEIAAKYLKLETDPIIFIINEDAIKKDFNDYLVDENFILKIDINKIKNSEKNKEINIVKLTTKTAENIKNANGIMIKGTEM